MPERVPRRAGLVVNVDYTAWGWIHLIVGLVAIAVGLGLMAGNMVARIVGVIFAVISATLNVLFIGAYPVWSTIVIAVDVIVIYAIVVHGRELKAEHRRIPELRVARGSIVRAGATRAGDRATAGGSAGACHTASPARVGSPRYDLMRSARRSSSRVPSPAVATASRSTAVRPSRGSKVSLNVWAAAIARASVGRSAVAFMALHCPCGRASPRRS
jgi:hypothetical protein